MRVHLTNGNAVIGAIGRRRCTVVVQAMLRHGSTRTRCLLHHGFTYGTPTCTNTVGTQVTAAR